MSPFGLIVLCAVISHTCADELDAQRAADELLERMLQEPVHQHEDLDGTVLGKTSQIALSTSRLAARSAWPSASFPSARFTNLPRSVFRNAAAARGQEELPAISADVARRSAMFSAASTAMMTALVQEARADDEKKSLGKRKAEKQALTDATTTLVEVKAMLGEIELAAKKGAAGNEIRPRPKTLYAYADLFKEVEQAFPVLLDCAYGGKPDDLPECMGEKKATTADGQKAADAIVASLNNVLKESRKSIRKEAFVDPSLSTKAISAVQVVLDQLPPQFVNSIEGLAAQTMVREGLTL
eukprot:gnl/TRDRNA2_/TRDRNA2_68024_c0_seq1.p1 gnl/TRDRNA2_/TRDRNA2_68024_c0~~gnl/TRDRNA2_/TRDRNA2_68024_c0_seq1.p1  ORF type:complete len:298 (-),score=48.02 gnl/TRDRNA2_/TRDRNA2_68024_c0_seq1:101-994(-)